MILNPFIASLMEQLEALQLVANNVAKALNGRGDLLVSHLQDIPMHAGEIALHGVCHGATVALTITQVRSRLELRWYQPSFACSDDHHDLVVDFEGPVDAMASTSLAEGIMNNVFFGLSLYLGVKMNK
jgi:hypothetical protein